MAREPSADRTNRERVCRVAIGRDPADPHAMTAEQRCAELSSLLARGVVRRRQGRHVVRGVTNRTPAQCGNDTKSSLSFTEKLALLDKPVNAGRDQGCGDR